VEDLLVAGAAAEIPRQRLADLVVGRIRRPAEERRGRDDEPGGAEAALHGAGLDERVLHRMEVAVGAEPFHGDGVWPVRLRGGDEAWAGELAVEEHRARPALALLTGVLRAGQAEPLAERVEEALARPDVGVLALAVDPDVDPHATRHLFSARPLRTRSACLR